MKQFDFQIGAQIHCRDGRIGTLEKLVVDPHNKRVIDLIVEKGFLQKKDRVLPLSIVDRVEDDNIYLTIHSTELPNYPFYKEEEFYVPAPGWEPTSPYRRQELRHWATRYGLEGAGDPVIPRIKKRVPQGIPGDAKSIGRSTPVRNVHGFVGKIDHLLVDEQSKEITNLIIEKGILHHHIVVPIDWVDSIDEDGILIRGTHQELKQLPRYTARPESDVLEEVQARLDNAPFDFGDVVATIEKGVLKLRGVVANIMEKRHAGELASSVQGVLDVENTLDTNTAIVARVDAALQSDPRTHLAVIEVINDRGIVTLSGNVPSVEVRTAAEEIAEHQAGVITVVNALEVKPREDEEDWIRPASVFPPVLAGVG